jgi:hypothetical protein
LAKAARDERRQKLQKKIAALENKVRHEKQFNIQVALNGELLSAFNSTLTPRTGCFPSCVIAAIW